MRRVGVQSSYSFYDAFITSHLLDALLYVVSLQLVGDGCTYTAEAWDRGPRALRLYGPPCAWDHDEVRYAFALRTNQQHWRQDPIALCYCIRVSSSLQCSAVQNMCYFLNLWVRNNRAQRIWLTDWPTDRLVIHPIRPSFYQPSYHCIYLCIYQSYWLSLSVYLSNRALEQLNYLGALDDDGALTPLGEHYTTLHYTVVRYTTLHRTTLHCNAIFVYSSPLSSAIITHKKFYWTRLLSTFNLTWFDMTCDTALHIRQDIKWLNSPSSLRWPKCF